ncbi:unnamed protein product [Allacma fusca]|uniref:RNA helicase n=1 Tax=Allacma fusca TaxID=39272 RepID=A0A8J2NUQ6_9HEXA|nr:unnamed protein product [Allacma fusca]
MMEVRKKMKRGDRATKKIIVVRKILAQLQHLLQIVEKRSTKYEENRNLLEVLLKALEEIKSDLRKEEEKLTTSIELIWSSIEETAFCLKNLEEVSEFDCENADDVYLPCYKRLDGVVRQYHNRKTRKWKKLRTKLEILAREKEENGPYKPGRQWEVIKFHFDSDDDCRIVDDPFADLPEKRRRRNGQRKGSTELSSSSKASTSQASQIPTEDDENFAKYLENEAQLLHEPRSLVMTLKTVSASTNQTAKNSISAPEIPVVQPQPAPVLQELSLNTENEEVVSRQTESFSSQTSISQEPTELSQCSTKSTVETIQPSSIMNLELYTGPACSTFEEMGLAQSLVCGVNLWGILNPYTIQKKGIPACLLGYDMIVHAPSGEGKTSLAAISALNKINSEIKAPQAIFLLPTQELAELTMGAMGDLGTFMDVTGVCCKFPEGVEFCHVFLGTPMSAHNLILNRRLCTEAIKILVIDAADEMPLEASSYIIKVLYNLGGDTQVLLSTRALTQQIACLSLKLRNPVYICCSSPEGPVSTVDMTVCADTEPHEIENEVPKAASIDFNNMNQFYVIVATDELKIRVLAALADTMETEQAIIFCNTAQKADWLARKIRENEKGLEVCSVHGGRQNKDHLITLFQAGVSRVLITTDFITRSNFKLKPIPLVLNYEFPELAENYTKRLMCAGRTKKAPVDCSGENPVLVFSFINPENLPVLESLAKKHDFSVTPMSSQTA